MRYNSFESKILKRKCGTLILGQPLKVKDFQEIVKNLRKRIFRLKYDFVTLKINYHKPIFGDILREYNFKFIEELITFYLKRKKLIPKKPVFFKKDKLKECSNYADEDKFVKKREQDKLIELIRESDEDC